MSGAAAALHSDHVNLLVFRYLQEIGFENAATAFYRDWHRPSEFHDPENYPFADRVQRNELVSIIQTGLHHDELQSRIRKSERRFRWTGNDARDSVEGNDGAAGSRPPSSGKRRIRPAGSRPLYDFAAPAAKRQRRSEGSEVHVNGDKDAMDVDAVSADAEADDDREAASPAMQSEAEPMEAVERYDSMDVATQTEAAKAAPKTSTIYWRVDKPGASIVHSIWNPDLRDTNRSTLLAVGESLCRFYQVPEFVEDAGQITHIDEPSLPMGSTVTASAWQPDGRGVACALSGIRELPDGGKVSSQMLVEHHREHGSTHFQLEPQLLEPPGVILSLRYSPNAASLLVAGTNGKRGVVQIWETRRPDAERSRGPREPIAWRIFDHALFDAAWVDDDSFLACGAAGLSALYQLDRTRKSPPQFDAGAAAVAGSVAMRGLVSHSSHILGALAPPASSPLCDWERVRYDARHRLVVFASPAARVLAVLALPKTSDADANGASKPPNVVLDLPDTLVALAFKPYPQLTDDDVSDSDPAAHPSLLAAAFADGSCLIYTLTRSSGPEAAAAAVSVRCIELLSLQLADGPALAVAWSPSGARLAVGNATLVQIWSADDLEQRKNGVRHAPHAEVIWRPKHQRQRQQREGGAREGGEEEEGDEDDEMGDGVGSAVVVEPSLSWSADGQSLAYAAEKQMAVICFRPPFSSSSSPPQPAHGSQRNGSSGGTSP